MSTESDIIGAITALSLFTKVRYAVADSESDEDPTALPFFVLGGAERDFEATRTFCGTALVISNYGALIAASTAAEARSLSDSVSAALTGIANINSSTDEYDEDGGFYTCNLTLTA